MTKSRLYYEAHITIESGDQTWEDFYNITVGSGFRCSRFSEDDVDSYNGHWFCSARSDIWKQIVSQLKYTKSNLEVSGFKIVRWKIEDTLLDSKYGDELP